MARHTTTPLRSLLTLFLGVSLMLSLQGCGKEEAKKKKERSVRITMATASALNYAESTNSLGRIESRYPARVSAMIAGRVSAIHADPGDRVKEGDLLAELELTDSALERETAAAKVRALDTTLREITQRLAQHEQASAPNIPNGALEEMRAQLKKTKDELHAARIRQELTESRQARTRILSPIEGIVDSRETSPGEYLRVGDALFHITGTQELRARLPLPQALAERLHSGQAVELRNPANPAYTLHTAISDVRPRVGEESRAVEVLVEFDNPGNWKPGASVNARIILEKPQRVVAVPEAAAVLRPAGTVVYLIDGERVRQRVITPGPRQDGMRIVRSGLELGEAIAVTGAGFLSDGAKISVQNHKEEKGPEDKKDQKKADEPKS